MGDKSQQGQGSLVSYIEMAEGNVTSIDIEKKLGVEHSNILLGCTSKGPSSPPSSAMTVS